MSLNKTAKGAAKGAATDDDTAASAASKTSNSLIVRIDQDSDDNLQALFDSVLNPGDSKRPLQVPFRMRNLPNSFFTPPAAGSARSPSVSHSRANSADSAYDAGSQQNVSQSAVGAAGGTQSAAVASTAAGGVAQSPGVPSSLTQAQQQAQSVAAAVVAAPPSRLAISHSRAHSSPASLQQTYSMHTNSANNSAAVPDGIGAAGGATGFAGSGGAGVGGFAAGGATAGSGVIGGLDRLGQCGDPPNALQTFHMKQRSYDVVSPIALQNELGALPPGWEQAKTNDGQIYYLNHATKTTQWEDPRIQYKQQQQQRLLQQALNQTVNLKAANKESVDIIESLGPLPEGWEQAFTESGDIYFINHINRTTSWNDPRIPDFLQKSIKVPKPEMSWVNVRQLEKEHEFFKQKPEQNAMTRHSASLQIDPFLSGDNHARQESSDSGLSLSSNTFSVNAEFISQIDDSMDCISENGSINAMSGLDCPDNLVSSLQLEDNICNEMFNDVHSLLNSSSTKPDNLEWYKIN